MCLSTATLVLAVTFNVGPTTTHGTEAVMKCYHKPSWFFVANWLDQQRAVMAKKAEIRHVAQMKRDGKG